MIGSETKNIVTAFEILLSELEREIEKINSAVSISLEKKEFESAENAIESARRLNAFKDKIDELQQEWELINTVVPSIKKKRHRTPKSTPRAKKGALTPEKSYYLPILKVLEEEGGSADCNLVVRRVGKIMSSILTHHDRKSVDSNPNQARWDNRTRWVRNKLVMMGLLKSNSPHGIWEITQDGREYIARHDVE